MNLKWLWNVCRLTRARRARCLSVHSQSSPRYMVTIWSILGHTVQHWWHLIGHIFVCIFFWNVLHVLPPMSSLNIKNSFSEHLTYPRTPWTVTTSTGPSTAWPLSPSTWSSASTRSSTQKPWPTAVPSNTGRFYLLSTPMTDWCMKTIHDLRTQRLLPTAAPPLNTKEPPGVGTSMNTKQYNDDLLYGGGGGSPWHGTVSWFLY